MLHAVATCKVCPTRLGKDLYTLQKFFTFKMATTNLLYASVNRYQVLISENIIADCSIMSNLCSHMVSDICLLFASTLSDLYSVSIHMVLYKHATALCASH